ncbi:MAG: hypothetical protein KVP17_003530 [Porospora cf. gigantea B]|uniref:uncharacterized protein n=1 Tax=Porospora cf. gigantea B TaxID=2853592 RepID=UPI0035719C1E|nr:MAG: hypothetical protein KVP17_003530 [Porospora cf. gigantea B]
MPDHLATQNLDTLDPAKLTPLTPEVISRQATINIGTIGHVAHGKSTIVRAISGVQTVRFKREKERNITIYLGYANAKVYCCENGNTEKCRSPECYKSYPSNHVDDPVCLKCGGAMVLKRHFSFVDCPGHDILMATMLNGAAVMDGALLLVAGNESCPQPQTSEHLAAVEIMRLKHLLILQNKVELIKKHQALQQHDEIRDFVKGTIAQNSPIIPVSAVLQFNIDVLCEYLVTQIPVPVRDFTSSPHMIIIRSFDVNKPGEDIEDLKGGVAGGTLLKGVLRVGDEIEIRPGVITQSDSGVVCTPIRSRIRSLFAEQNELQFAVPGGLIGVGTQLDPKLTRSDRLVGSVLGAPGHLPDIYDEIKISYYLLRRLLGVKSDDSRAEVSKLKSKEYLMLNIGSTTVGARVKKVDKDKMCRLSLSLPVCAGIGSNVALSRRIEKHWRLIGWGQILKGRS